MKRLLAGLSFCILVAAAWAADLVPLPSLAARVTDLTATLTPAQKQTLELRLADEERRKGSQVAILMLPTTKPETIEQYGIRLAEAWKLGRKGIDDGVILIVAKDDRRMRIEVGYGLEGVLNDATSKRIVSETITPHFKRGDYFGGLQAGVDAIIGAIEQESLPAPGERAMRRPGPGEGDDWMVWLLAVLVLASLARSMLGIVGSFGAAGFAGFLAFSAFGIMAAVLAAVAAFVLSFVPLSFIMRGAGGLGGGRGLGSGSGGFGGRGGGFGGGGASGNW